MPLGRPRSNAAKPSAENLEWLTNSPRGHRALPVTLSCGLVNSVRPSGSSRHFGLQEVGMPLEREAAVDLLADEPERPLAPSRKNQTARLVASRRQTPGAAGRILLRYLAENAAHLVSGKGGKRLRPNIAQRTEA
jgi:hypothetical protein